MSEKPAKSKDIISLWLERVDYDFHAATAMLKSGHFLYVAFLCQQAVEKALKALWCAKHDDPPPYIHNLMVLGESLQLDLSSDQQSIIERLNRYYIVGRYPSFKQQLASALDKKESTVILKQTEEFLTWCKKRIKT